MERQIFEVHKKALGSSVGGYVPMASGYPKVFDSHAPHAPIPSAEVTVPLWAGL